MTLSLSALWFAREPHDADGSARLTGISGRVASQSLDAIADIASSQPGTTEERALVARIRAGDEAAFDALFRTEFPRVVGFVTALLGSAEAAQDVAAELFSRVWKRRHEWEPQGSIAAYFFRAARNQAANVRRGERRFGTWRAAFAQSERTPGMGSSPRSADATIEHAEAIAALWHAVDALPPQRRAIAYLRWREGMEYEEIAAVTGHSVAAVKMQVSRTLTALRAVVPGLME